MIHLPDVPLPPKAAARLKHWQGEIDRIPRYADRIARAASLYKSRNIPRNRTFATVRESLGRMCCGSVRCCYCEDGSADEVEHILPKNYYPDLSFVWDNYLYACGSCNGPKNNRHAIIKNDGEFVEFGRTKDMIVDVPPEGISTLINPRIEDPLAFFELDIAGAWSTYRFVPLPGISSEARQRALWTIDVLRLNRSVLTRARKGAHFFYGCCLKVYANEKKEGGSQILLNMLRNEIHRLPHPTVMREMQRQSHLQKDLEELFLSIPEALTWQVGVRRV